jgi:hypothetical protein
MKGNWIAALAAMLLLVGTGGTARAQDSLPPDEPDTEAFINANFHLQDRYSGVLCVAGDGSCPANVTVSVPCLVANCTPDPQPYPVAETFTTIQAAADGAQPGDLVIIMPGRYRGIQYEARGGADGAYIEFRGWGDPGAVIVDGVAFPEKSWLRDLFYFIDAHYIIIDHLAFEGAPRAGILSSGYFSETGHFADHFVVLDVYSHDNGSWGLHTTATSYFLIQDSVFANSREEHGAYISGSGDHGVIRRNVFQGNDAAGLQINADPQTATEELFGWLGNSTGDTCGISEDDVWRTEWQTVKACYDAQGLPDLGEAIEDGISQDVIVEQNVITGNGASGGAGINLASVRASWVRNNLIYGNGAAGIACWDNGYAEEKELASSDFGCQTVEISHNTLVDESGNRGALIINQDARDMVVIDDIIIRDRFDAYEIAGRSGQGLMSMANAYSAQNVEDSPGIAFGDDNPDSGSITGFSVADGLANFVAPGFAPWLNPDGPWPVLNPDRPDYHLRPDSPWLSAGLSGGVTRYLDGTLRMDNALGALGPGEASAAAAAPTPAVSVPSGGTASGLAGVITYAVGDNGPVYRIAAQEGAQPESISQALDALAAGTDDEWLNVSPDGAWLLTSTDRFDPDCVGWPCLTLLPSDLSAWDVIRVGEELIHSDGFSAVGPGGDVVVYPASGGPHELDLWAVTRLNQAWTGPVLITGESPYAWNSQPAISGDGAQLVFDCGDEPYAAAGTAICTVYTDGSGFAVALTPDMLPGVDATQIALHHADFLPGGGYVFESNWRDGEQIWRASPDGISLIADRFTNDNSPCALADGRIVSLWLNRPENADGYHEIKVMSADGSDYTMALTGVDVLDGGIGCGG